MKRLGGLWAGVVDFDNLWLAWRKARRGKGGRAPVHHFALDLEGQLLRLQAELEAGTYRPGAYRQFTVYERKPRVRNGALASRLATSPASSSPTCISIVSTTG